MFDNDDTVERAWTCMLQGLEDGPEFGWTSPIGRTLFISTTAEMSWILQYSLEGKSFESYYLAGTTRSTMLLCTTLPTRLATDIIEPPHEIMSLFVLRKFILQTRMPSHRIILFSRNDKKYHVTVYDATDQASYRHNWAASWDYVTFRPP